MLNRMNKHINTLSSRSVQLLEKTEHGLKKIPTVAEMQSMEMVEHKLAKKPSLRELLKFETKEHAKVEEEDDDMEDDDAEENGNIKEPYGYNLGALIVKGKSK